MKLLFAISTALLLLFVVVCPLTATPTAVVHGKDVQNPHMLVYALGAVSLVVANLPVLCLVSYVAEHVAVSCAGELLDLTCARLC